jgi:hypothetical protein
MVTSGYGTYISAAVNNQDNDYAPAARTPDGTLGLVYMPTARTITVALDSFSGAVTARWFDPTAGTQTAGSSMPNTGTHAFTPPAASHSDGSSDWVLVLETL